MIQMELGRSIINAMKGGQSGSATVKLTRLASVAEGLPPNPDADLCTTCQALLWQVSHIESRGRLAQMLAQGQSSSKKKFIE